MKTPVLSKNSLKFSIILLLLISVLSCHKYEEPDEQALLKSSQISSFIFELNCYALTGECKLEFPEKYYYPQELKLFAGRYYFYRGKSSIFAEKFAPEYIGTIESSGFYTGVDDSADWVDSLLILMEEERIAAEIKLLEDDENELPEGEENLMELLNDSETSLAQENINENAEIAALEKEFPVIEILNKSKELNSMKYDKEIFMPQKTKNGWILIQSVTNGVERCFYDEYFRLTRKETWKISGIQNSEIIQAEELFYKEDFMKAYKKEIKTKDSLQIAKYNENGLVTNLEKYAIVEDKNYAISVLNRKYDASNQLISNEIIEIYYKNDDYKKLDYKISKRYDYEYNPDEEIPPDFEYYEDNVLRMKNKYSNIKGNYTSQIFFEGNFSVKTYYEDELKIKDVYYQDDEVIRIKNYEN